jgi:hypothetical protein
VWAGRVTGRAVRRCALEGQRQTVLVAAEYWVVAGVLAGAEEAPVPGPILVTKPELQRRLNLLAHPVNFLGRSHAGRGAKKSVLCIRDRNESLYAVLLLSTPLIAT